MDYYTLLENERKNFKEKQLFLTKEDINFISSKETFKDKLHGFLTVSYHQREKVIRTGELFYGYVFSEWKSRPDSQPISLILFSPETKIAQNPSIFKKITENLYGFLKISHRNRKDKKLKNLLTEPLANAPFEALPYTITEGHIVYFCKIYRNISFANSFNLGLNLFISNPAVSKQIMYLPERYMTETFKNLYEENKLNL